MIRLENVSKTSWRSFWKTSRRSFGDLFKKSCQDALKIYWGSFCKTSWKRPENVLKTSCLEDVLKTSWISLEDVWPRQKYWSWSRRLEDIFKTYSEEIWLGWMYSSWSRRLEDVFWRGRRKTSSTRLQDVFIKTNASWKYSGCTKKCVFVWANIKLKLFIFQIINCFYLKDRSLTSHNISMSLGMKLFYFLFLKMKFCSQILSFKLFRIYISIIWQYFFLFRFIQEDKQI